VEHDPGVIADTMIGNYGAGAEDMAKKYAERMKRTGDDDVYAFWLRVCEIIRQRQKKR
jgi:hypothetical protein